MNSQTPASQRASETRRGWWIALAAIVAAAAVLRMCNLGSFSIWLDEAFTMVRAEMPLRECLADCATDAENVPLYAITAFISLRLGLVEPWIRLVPIMAGLASICAWAWWTRRHFGPHTALLTAGFMALSTFHLRQSQELRAYPFLLLVTALAMLSADRLRRQPNLATTMTLAAVVGVGWYTHLTFAMFLVPLIGLGFVPLRQPETESPDRHRRVAVRLFGAIAIGSLTLLPWMLITHDTLQRRLSRGPTVWTLEIVGLRWQFLTVAAAEGDLLDWLGTVLAALLVVGLVIAARTSMGRVVILPAAATIVVVEFLFLAVNRWSKARYDTAIWPFLAILVALGLLWILRILRQRWLPSTAIALLGLAMLIHVDGYHRRGRPHWDRIVAAITEVRRPGEPLLTENEWTRYLLDYLHGGPFVALERGLEPLAEGLSRTQSALVVIGPPPRSRELRSIARRSTLIAGIPQTARLYRVRADVVSVEADFRNGVWPAPASQLIPIELEEPLPGCLGGLLGRNQDPTRLSDSRMRIDFDKASSPSLRSGWSRPKRRWDDTTFAWAVGREASVVIRRERPISARIELRLWPHPTLATQQLRLVVNGIPLGVVALKTGARNVALAAPESVWRAGRNLVVLQFRTSEQQDDGRSVPRAAAVDWLRVVPDSQF